jgi:hypothetical protein
MNRHIMLKINSLIQIKSNVLTELNNLRKINDNPTDPILRINKYKSNLKRIKCILFFAFADAVSVYWKNLTGNIYAEPRKNVFCNKKYF